MTERTGSQTRDILLGGNRLSRGATPTGDASVPEFRRVALRRTPSREQLTDEQAHKRSTFKKSTVMEASSMSSSNTNLSRSASFTSVTAINKTVLSRRDSTASEDKQQPEFKGVVLKKTGSKPGSRAGSPTRLDSGSRGEMSASAASLLKKVEMSSSASSRRGSATSETTAEFANVSLKKAKRVQGDQNKFEVEQVSLKPIPVGEGEETTVSSSSMGMRREERASSVTRQRVLRETKFEANDEEYHDIKSSLDRLKKKDASPAQALSVEDDAAEGKKKAPHKPALAAEDDAAAKPLVFRRPKRLAREEKEAEKVQLKPIDRQKSSQDNTPAIDDDDDDEVARSLALRRSKRTAQEKEQVEKVQLKQVNQEKSSKDESITKDEAAILSLAEKKQEKLTQQQDAERIQPESVKTKKSSKDASPAEDDAAAKPVAYRRPKMLPKEEEDEAERVHLKPISREKKTFTSSIECLKKATEEEERQEMKMKMERPVLLRKTSYTSSLDNIAIGGEEQKQVQ